jgi:transcriptional regulator with GAF, ATPase, and Fis domain
MPANAYTLYYSQPDSLSEQDKEELCFFENYFASKKDYPAFPFVIFSDHIPGKNEIDKIPGLNAIYEKKSKPVILALKKKSVQDLSSCWNLLSRGIDDIIEWVSEDEMVTYLESKFTRNNTIREILESSPVKENLVGDSLVWKNFLCDLIETTLFSQTSVLLIGESGTGKELISRLIHNLDKRPDKKKLVVVDCTTIVPELSGSELFGHERGSYTNAIQSREGACSLANGGTLFLDEIGELPLILQAELLRVLQEGTYKKVGSNNWQKTSFRLVCATNRNLKHAVAEGRFRQDLYFRISDCQFHVPALDERKEDIPVLVNYFLSKLFDEKKCPELDKPVIEYLVKRKYPGNIRELKQLVNRLALKHVEHRKITIGEVPAEDRFADDTEKTNNNGHDSIESIIRKALLTGEDWWKLKDRISETAIQVALDLEENNKQKAAERLGVDVRTVQQYVKKKTLS